MAHVLTGWGSKSHRVCSCTCAILVLMPQGVMHRLMELKGGLVRVASRLSVGWLQPKGSKSSSKDVTRWLTGMRLELSGSSRATTCQCFSIRICAHACVCVCVCMSRVGMCKPCAGTCFTLVPCWGHLVGTELDQCLPRNAAGLLTCTGPADPHVSDPMANGALRLSMLCTHKRTHIHTRAHTSTHTHTHARTHAHTHAHAHTHTRTCSHLVFFRVVQPKGQAVHRAAQVILGQEPSLAGVIGPQHLPDIRLLAAGRDPVHNLLDRWPVCEHAFGEGPPLAACGRACDTQPVACAWHASTQLQGRVLWPRSRIYGQNTAYCVDRMDNFCYI